MIRDHPIFSTPLAVDRQLLIDRPWPADWTDTHDRDVIRVLPLARNEDFGRTPGWCTYTNDMAEAPEVEVFCGGINQKTATAAAVWRQGNLLHYGFDLSPDEMNASGRAILVDAISYIARFTEDRPIMETPSPFRGHEFMTRNRIEAYLRRDDRVIWDYLQAHFDPKTLADAGVTDRRSFAKWYPAIRDHLCPDAMGRLRVDEDARAAGMSPGRREFIDWAIASMDLPDEEGPRARRLLVRYAPEGPGWEASRNAWADWWRANADYCFFGEAGGYRWYLDPLARARRVPTAQLRGPSRATR